MNPYRKYLKLLATSDLRSCLAVACAEEGISSGLPQGKMEFLEDLDLVHRHLLGWKPTWLGHGVNNWRRQVEASLFRDPGLPVPEPGERENGRDPAPDCGGFREMLFQPGMCWCLRPAHSHPSYISQLAAEFLAWHNDNQRSLKLQSCGSGRDFKSVSGGLNSLDRSILQFALQRQESPLQLGEIAAHFGCLVDFFSLKASVDRLQDLELVDSRSGLVLTWDGRGLCQWLSEVECSRRRGLPMESPLPGENGVDCLAAPCAMFRALLHAPDRCWCGWSRQEHKED